jgi:hypothetical protein
MGVAWPHRAVYRVRQFGSAVAAGIRPLTTAEQAEARAWLPPTAWPLFDAMPHNDQRHSLAVMRSLHAAGHAEPALMQAALLHDAAKSTGRVTLFHRVAVVLIKIVWPGWTTRTAQTPAPARGSFGYPFWAHANHPQLGAEMAASAGCDPLAVTLIRRHQETGRGAAAREPRGRGDITLLLAALQAADDDN